MIFYKSVFILLLFVCASLGDHYKGGSLSWKPVNAYATSGPVQIIITERHSWSLTRYACTNTTINTLGSYNDTQASQIAMVTCISSSATCTSSLFQSITAPLYCTEFSTKFQISTGTYYTTQSLTWSSVIDIASRGASWTSETLTNDWSLVSHMDLTPVSGKINSSPVTGSLPIFQTYVSEVTVIQILAADADAGQVVRCRWSYQSLTDECGSICYDLPNAVLSPTDCTIQWTPVLRSADTANGLTQSTYVIAITAEDFENASSTTPLSSVPHQVLVYVSYRENGTCATRPTVSSFGTRNGACNAISIGGAYTFTFQARIYCYGSTDAIVEFLSSTPFVTYKSGIYRVNNYTWAVTFKWTPQTAQTGLQPFCIGAVDNHGQATSQYCIMYVVGASSPSYSFPTVIQGTASPVGTVLSTQSRFSIQTNTQLRRTTMSQTYIYIIRSSNGAIVRTIDCKYSPDVYFVNKTIVFFIQNPTWTLGASYYVYFTSGVITADQYCGVEASAYSGYISWVFTIWKPAGSSTTTPSTTTSTATTHTVTTRYQGTTTYNTLYTTTGLPAYTTSSTTSTTSTTSTSATTTTTTSATTSTTTTTTTTQYIPNANVIYPKDLETACVQPVLISTVLVSVVSHVVHTVLIINLFVRVIANHHKDVLKARSVIHNSLRHASTVEERRALLKI